jgi:hypothetical protein
MLRHRTTAGAELCPFPSFVKLALIATNSDPDSWLGVGGGEGFD